MPRKSPGCSAIIAHQYRSQQPWVKMCDNSATFLCNGVPLCGIHVNTPPKAYVATFEGGIVTTEVVSG